MEWKEREIQDPTIVSSLSTELNSLSESLTRALVLRGIDSYETARNYFRGTKHELFDPHGLADVELAAQRIAKAISEKERVLVYGDFDADGVTSTAILLKFLQSHQVETRFYIPHRQKENHGFHKSGVDYAYAENCSLIIVVDCGTNDEETAEFSKHKGIDLVICDHHENDGSAPICCAHVNPNQARCSYANKEISACALAFKIIQVTLETLGKSPELADQYLDLVAISTVCDVMPLVGENRILVREGLQVLHSSNHPALRALITTAKLDPKHLMTSNIAMQLGPRINAAGRMSHAREALHLLMADSDAEAKRFSQRLDHLNRLRKVEGAKLQPKASKLARAQLAGKHTSALVLYHAQWHPGILGIGATKIAKEFRVPTVILTDVPNSDDSEIFGSVRTFGDIHILDAITPCQDILIRFGGHAKAAGLTLKKENLVLFKERLNFEVAKQSSDQTITSHIEYDAPLKVEEIPGRFHRVLNLCEPFGKANEPPLFMMKNLRPIDVKLLKGGQHLKMNVQSPDSSFCISAIGFGMANHYQIAEEARVQKTSIDLLCHVEENWWKGNVTTQLRFIALRAYSQS